MKFTAQPVQAPSLAQAWATYDPADGADLARVQREDKLLVVGKPPVSRSPIETVQLAQPIMPVVNSLAEMFSGGASARGFHSVSKFLACPERSRLQAEGWQKKKREVFDTPDGQYQEELDALGIGTAVHYLLALRVSHGMGLVETIIGDLNVESAGLGFSEQDKLKLLNIVRTYDNNFPFGSDPWRYISLEGEVVTDIGDGFGGSCPRSARYDAVVQHIDPQTGYAKRGVFSLEKKTAARSGGGAMEVYMPQFATQVAIWNSNPNLVAAYGPMMGVIPDVIIKTAVPKCERYAPRYISRFLQHRAVEYLRLPEAVKYPTNADGSYPRMLHSCWDRYRACEYVNLCWEGSFGDYEVK
jgi:hypothetical protein